MAEEQCIFCHIAKGDVPAKKVYEDDKVVAILDINPAKPGHILLITKEHAQIMPQLSDEVIAHVGMIAKQLSHALIRGLTVEGTSIFIANGMAAGQRAPHFMLHVIPREVDDGLQLQLSPVKIPAEVMKQVYDRLSGPIAKQFGLEVST